MEQANDTHEPSTVAINEPFTDMSLGEEVKGTHPDIRRACKVSNPTVKDYPVEQIEYHKPCKEDRTDQLDTQIKQPGLNIIVAPTKIKIRKLKASTYMQRRRLIDPTLQ